MIDRVRLAFDEVELDRARAVRWNRSARQCRGACPSATVPQVELRLDGVPKACCGVLIGMANPAFVSAIVLGLDSVTENVTGAP